MPPQPKLQGVLIRRVSTLGSADVTYHLSKDRVTYAVFATAKAASDAAIAFATQHHTEVWLEDCDERGRVLSVKRLWPLGNR